MDDAPSAGYSRGIVPAGSYTCLRAVLGRVNLCESSFLDCFHHDFILFLPVTFRKTVDLLLKMTTWILGSQTEIKTSKIRRKKRKKQKLMTMDKAKTKLMNK